MGNVSASSTSSEPEPGPGQELGQRRKQDQKEEPNSHRKQTGRLFHVNYADRRFYQSQKRSTESALQRGGFDYAWSLSRHDLDDDFVARNHDVLALQRGAGLWLWKPYVVFRVLNDETLREGDFLFYADSGSEWIGPVDPYMTHMNATNADVLLFQLTGDGLNERNYTKPFTRQALSCTQQECLNSRQIQGSFLMCRKSGRSLSFAREWLELAQNPLLLTDDDPNFIHHRHDQSILSLLAKKPDAAKRFHIAVVPDPSQYGNFHRTSMTAKRTNQFPALIQILDHTRSSA